MRRWTLAAIAFVALCSVSRLSAACECVAYDSQTQVWQSSIIIDGVVIARDPPSAVPDPFVTKYATMSIETVWKGSPPETVTLFYSEDEGACGAVPPLGVKLRIGSSYVRDGQVWFGMCTGLSLADKALERAIQSYVARTKAAILDFEDQGPYGRLALAHYFRLNREYERALRTLSHTSENEPAYAESMIEASISEAALNGTNAAQARLEAARAHWGSNARLAGALARGQFEALGQLDSNWKDWSDLENNAFCDGRTRNLAGARFDRARLSHCDFADADLRGATLLGADVRGSDLTQARLDGAIFNCATQFQPNFDPLARGMINKDGSCPN